VFALLVEANPIPDMDYLDLVDVGGATYLATLEQRSSEVTKIDIEQTSETDKKKPNMVWLAAAATAVIVGIAFVLVTQGGEEAQVATQVTVSAAEQTAVYPRGANVGDLPGTRWSVYTFVVDGKETRKLADTTIILHFGYDGTINGTGGCNDYQATYQQTGDYVPNEQGFGRSVRGVFIEFQEFTSTNNACGSTALMEQEALYFESLQQTGRWWISQDRELALGLTKGDQLLAARPQPEE
jgi:heat shock protein HslJ